MTVTLNFNFVGVIVLLEFVLNFLAKKSKGKRMTSSLALFVNISWRGKRSIPYKGVETSP